jgi:hypothetical protein
MAGIAEIEREIRRQLEELARQPGAALDTERDRLRRALRALAAPEPPRPRLHCAGVRLRNARLPTW